MEIYGWELLAVCHQTGKFETMDILIVKTKNTSSKT